MLEIILIHSNSIDIIMILKMKYKYMTQHTEVLSADPRCKMPAYLYLFTTSQQHMLKDPIFLKLKTGTLNNI